MPLRILAFVALLVVLTACDSDGDPPGRDGGTPPELQCENGEIDGDEVGIDCGGNCPNQDCCANGVLDENLGEIGVDCGGSCDDRTCCANGVLDENLGEIGVDCGGSCDDRTCCANGVLDENLGELGVDCGGSCSACPEPDCSEDGPCADGERCCGTYCVVGECYYVSNTGDDSNVGTDESHPWRSLARVGELTTSPGDAVLFRRGNAWVGSLEMTATGAEGAPVLVGAYGDGDRPTIYGSEEITGWTEDDGGIYRAAVATEITQLFMDGERLQVARYPNEGMLHVTAVAGPTRFSSDELRDEGADSYVGAKLIIHTNGWRLDTHDVVASHGQTLTIDSETSYGLAVGQEFYLANKRNFLDHPGEWYYDSDTSTVYAWLPDGGSPNEHQMRGSSFETGISILGSTHVVLRDLNVLQPQLRGVAVQDSDFVTLADNEIRQAEIFGIVISGSNGNNTVSGNLIDGVNHVALSIVGDQNVVSNNRFLRTALIDQLGVHGMDGFSYVVSSSGEDTTIRGNRVVDAGYTGIAWTGQNADISYNYIENVCTVLRDGGGIYTYSRDVSVPLSSGSVIARNILVNIASAVSAIYMDERTRDVVIEDNTVAHCGRMGIFFHDTMGVEARGNTLFDTSRGMRATGTHGGNSSHDNLFCNLEETIDEADGSRAKLMLLDPTEGTLAMDHNTYVDHHRTKVFMRTDIYAYLDFDEWRAVTGGDASSTAYHEALAPGEREELFYNDTMALVEIPLSGAYRDLDGTPVASPLALQPFASKILIRE